MHLFKALLGLLTSLQLAHAFFPWTPNYRCILDYTCISPSKRDLQAEVAVPNPVVSLKIVQRLPENDIPHRVQVRGLAARLSNKYVSRQNQRLSSSEDANYNLMKRGTNTYPIVSAAVPTQTRSAGIDQDGTDFSYFAQVLLGSKNKPLYMLLDSGAGQSWVMGPSCSSAPCSIHNSFGAPDSATFQAIDDSTFNIGYGSGQVSGTYGNDTLSIAGITLPVTLGIANVTSNDFNAFPFDGILGLSQTLGQYPTFIQSLVGSKSLQSNILGVSINRESDGPNTGEISFGSLDTSRFSGSINYNAVSTAANGDWAIPMDGLGLVGADAGITGRLAYIDTGTSYIFAPPDDVAKLHKLIPGAKSMDSSTWSVPCTTTTSLTFTFSGVSYNVPAKDWVGPMADGTCTSNVYGNAVVAGQWLLGDTFLKNVYTVFDIDKSRVGFGLKQASSSATSSATGNSSPTGGPISSSAATSSSAAVSISGTADTMSQTNSNAGPTGSSSSTMTLPNAAATSTTSGQSLPSETAGAPGTPGLSGHQTSDVSGTAAAETSTSATASPTKKSASARLDLNIPAMIFTVIALSLIS